MTNKLVLIVESNPAIREVLGMLLEDEIENVRTVGTGDFSSAVRLARSLQPATIVLDLKLDGIVATPSRRAYSLGQQPPRSL